MEKLSPQESKQVLTIGCSYNPPKGGIAQVMYTYSQSVFSRFQCITNSGRGGRLKQLSHAIYALICVFFKLMTDKRIKIVHIHTASYVSFQRSSYFVRLAKLMKRKVVLHVHGGGFKEYYQTNPLWIRNILEKTDAIIALTEDWKTFFTNQVGVKHVYVVPNIIEQPQQREIDKPKNVVQLLFLGSIVEQKGIFDLLDVLHEHKETLVGKIHLHVGGNHEVERLQRYIYDFQLENLVTYEGWVSGEKKITLLNMMDAFILPSYVEGLPISILESLSYGKPVITTPVGGIPEVVNENNGFLFAPGDKDAMFTILEEIINNPLVLKQKAAEAKASVLGNMPACVAASLHSIYSQL